MEREEYLVTVTHDGKRYRGAYYLDGGNLVVYATGIGEKHVDASLVGESMDSAAMKLAKLMLKELLREVVGESSSPDNLAVQGSTTRLTICGGTTQFSML